MSFLKQNTGFTPTPIPCTGHSATTASDIRITSRRYNLLLGRIGAGFQSKRGFTLIEMIVYAVILGVIAVLAVSSMIQMTKAYVNLRVSRDMNASATAVLERMTREIRGAQSIDVAQSTFGANPGRLMLNTKDAGGADTTVEFYVENGLIKVKEGGIAKGPLMTSSTQANSFIVRQLSSANSQAIKVELVVAATRGDVSKTRNFYNTIVSRGSY